MTDFEASNFDDKSIVLCERPHIIPDYRALLARSGVSESFATRLTSPKREAEDEPDSESNSRKRRRVQAPSSNDGYLNQYMALMNREVEVFIGNEFESDSISRVKSRREALDGSTKHGTIEWSQQERDRFFFALERKGRHDLPGISQIIGTKSMPEVAEYLGMLRDGYRTRHRHFDKTRLHRYQELPSSTEISPLLEERLDNFADMARKKESRRALQRARTIFGDLAVIDFEKAKKLARDQRPKINDQGLARGTFEFAVDFFKISNMLWLSTSVFMNSMKEEDNWSSIAEDGMQPSILQTALIDLCNLVVTITEKVVASAHFLALSRVRATTAGSGKATSQEIKRSDVRTALEILRMPVDSREYWTKCPRRCNLKVVNDVMNAGGEPGISYDIVEGNLTEDAFDPSDEDRRERKHEDSSSDDDNCSENEHSRPSSGWRAARSSSCASRHNPDAESIGPDSRMTSDLTGWNDSGSDEEAIEAAKAHAAELADLEDQKVEEEKLRALLGLSASDEQQEELEALDDHAISPKTRKSAARLERKTDKDLRDWRDFCNYKSRWERYPEPFEHIILPAHSPVASSESSEQDGRSVSERAASSQDASTQSDSEDAELESDVNELMEE